ncbi:YkgJ family cysteine cluster protein [Candidatus Woesearchaeota archaeon]|nr:YkgJ family cysteine cluster protein [Candidatus Woesearchaeota archaeon]
MVELIIKQPYNKFKFKCQQCALCCKGSQIILYPFDIMSLCKELNIKTSEFLKKYAYLQLDKNNILRCVLKNKPICMFNKENKCSVYEARPVRCKTFPVGRIFQEDKTLYTLPKIKGCSGFNSNKKQTIEEYLKAQNVNEKLEKEWSLFILKLKKSNAPLKDKFFLTLFTKIFYDFDNEMIQKFKNKIKIEDTLEENVKLLYQAFNYFFSNFEKIRQGFKEFSKEKSE